MFKTMIAAAQRQAMGRPGEVTCSLCKQTHTLDLDEVCNVCVQKDEFRCADCATLPGVKKCGGCAYPVGKCHSKLLDGVIIEQTGVLRREKTTVCCNTDCIENWLDEQGELLLAPHQELFIGLAAYKLLRHLKTHKLDVPTKKRALEDD